MVINTPFTSCSLTPMILALLFTTEMVGWQHRLSGRDSEHTPGDGDGQRCRMFCGPWCHKESDTTERLRNISQRQHRAFASASSRSSRSFIGSIISLFWTDFPYLNIFQLWLSFLSCLHFQSIFLDLLLISCICLKSLYIHWIIHFHNSVLLIPLLLF